MSGDAVASPPNVARSVSSDSYRRGSQGRSSPSSGVENLDMDPFTGQYETDRHSIIHMTFGLGEGERIRHDFSCAIRSRRGGFPLHGRMYITQRYLCFYSNLFGHETKKAIALADIVAIKGKSRFLMINSVEVHLANKRSYTFGSFFGQDKERCLDALRLFATNALDTSSVCTGAPSPRPSPAISVCSAPGTEPNNGGVSSPPGGPPRVRVSTAPITAPTMDISSPHAAAQAAEAQPEAAVDTARSTVDKAATAAVGVSSPPPADSASIFRSISSPASPESTGSTGHATGSGGAGAMMGAMDISPTPSPRSSLGSSPTVATPKFHADLDGGRALGGAGGAGGAAEADGGGGASASASAAPAAAAAATLPIKCIKPIGLGADMSEITRGSLECTAAEFFSHFVSGGAPFSNVRYHAERGDSELSETDWEMSEVLGVSRTIRLRTPIKGAPIGPKSTRVCKTQRFSLYGHSGQQLTLPGPCSDRLDLKTLSGLGIKTVVVDTSSQMLDIPYSTYFTVEDRWVVNETSRLMGEEGGNANAAAAAAAAAGDTGGGGGTCTVVMGLNVKFSKYTMWGKTISSKTEKDVKLSNQCWLDSAAKHIRGGAAAGGGPDARAVGEAAPAAAVGTSNSGPGGPAVTQAGQQHGEGQDKSQDGKGAAEEEAKGAWMSIQVGGGRSRGWGQVTRGVWASILSVLLLITMMLLYKEVRGMSDRLGDLERTNLLLLERLEAFQREKFQGSPDRIDRSVCAGDEGTGDMGGGATSSASTAAGGAQGSSQHAQQQSKALAALGRSIENSLVNEKRLHALQNLTRAQLKHMAAEFEGTVTELIDHVRRVPGE